jgi:hypothetical protein
METQATTEQIDVNQEINQLQGLVKATNNNLPVALAIFIALLIVKFKQSERKQIDCEKVTTDLTKRIEKLEEKIKEQNY